MHAVVSLLDDTSSKMVENLWAEIDREFNVGGIYQTPFPHISYHVCGDYHLDKVKTVMQVFARHTSPFRVRMAGLGIFSGPSPVLYIPIVRSPQLAEFQHELWHQVTKSSGRLEFAYRPARWVPHITLAQNDLTQKELAAIVRKYCTLELNQQVTLNNLALIYDMGEEHEVIYRVEMNESVGHRRYKPWGASRYER